MGLSVRDAMVTGPDTASAGATLRSFMDEVFAGSRHTAYPVTDDGEVLGSVMFRDVAAVPSAEWGRRRIGEVMTPLAATLRFGPDEPLFDATLSLMQSSSGRALVLSDGRLVGLLSVTDLSRLLELRRLATGRA